MSLMNWVSWVNELDWSWLIRLCGLAQVGIALVSLTIPHILGWKQETQKLRTLTRQVFWTYAGYIFAINLFFGVVCLVWPRQVILAGPIVSVFLALYWGVRLVLQMVVFDRSEAPKGLWPTIGELTLTGSFALLAGVFGFTVALGWS